MPARTATRAALAISVLIAALGVAPATAYAATPASSSPTPASTTAGYPTLSAALATMYAQNAKMSVSSFLAANPTTGQILLGKGGPPLTVDPALAAPTLHLPSMSAPTLPQLQQPTLSIPNAPATASLPAAPMLALNQQLVSSGQVPNPAQYQSLRAYGAALVGSGAGADAAVASAGAQWAAQIAALHTPAVATPNAPTPTMPTIPQGSLIFGSYLDKAMTAMVSSFPNVYAQVQSSGVGTPQSQADWNTAMQKAFQATQASPTAGFPDPCAGILLQAMGSGAVQPSAASSASCPQASTCIASGLYMHSKMQTLFAPGVTSTIPTSAPRSGAGSVMPPASWNQLPAWQRQVILSQNPNLKQALAQSTQAASAPSACAGATPALSGALATSLPGIFSHLAG